MPPRWLAEVEFRVERTWCSGSARQSEISPWFKKSSTAGKRLTSLPAASEIKGISCMFCTCPVIFPLLHRQALNTKRYTLVLLVSVLALLLSRSLPSSCLALLPMIRFSEL